MYNTVMEIERFTKGHLSKLVFVGRKIEAKDLRIILSSYASWYDTSSDRQLEKRP